MAVSVGDEFETYENIYPIFSSSIFSELDIFHIFFNITLLLDVKFR